MTTDEYLGRQLQYHMQRNMVDDSMESTDCPVCMQPFYLPFRWGTESMEYAFQFDEEMEQYMQEHGISHERTLLEQQTLHIRLLYICLTSINGAYLIDDLDHEINRVTVDDTGPFETIEPASNMPDELQSELDELMAAPQSRDPTESAETQRICALLSLREHIPVRELRGIFKGGVRFVNSSMQETLEWSFPVTSVGK
ncbi:hypothetical protein ACJ73_08516 [Blastomyces percursus]|uniref:Uncharacterized protein n=1 Tax=Blastomyces percursus TaxID=1658174 RepID=A0A1J9QWB2_9EURO|nr:hypothetical protein ACJ73_08516 [Blastomyces percursus]